MPLLSSVFLVNCAVCVGILPSLLEVAFEWETDIRLFAGLVVSLLSILLECVNHLHVYFICQ